MLSDTGEQSSQIDNSTLNTQHSTLKKTPLSTLNTQHFIELDSTMRVAEEYARTHDTHFLITADTQTAARGRKANDWHAPLGGLWFTLGLHHISSQKAFTLYIGYCVLKALHKVLSVESRELSDTGELNAPLNSSTLNPPHSTLFQIKWPNDIYLHDHKICGLICSQYPQYHKTLVGIGVNTNQDLRSQTSDLRTYQSIKSLLNINIPNQTYLQFIINQIFSELETFEKEGIYLFNDYYTKHDYLKDKTLKIISGNKQHSGKYVGINHDGGLLLLDDNGEVKTIYSGTIIY